MDELKICYLYPDVLNLFSDGGNITCIEKRLEWRGMKAEVTRVSLGENFCADDYDMFFIGGGQDFEQGMHLSDLMGGKAAEIRKAVEDEKVFLAVDTGFELLGKYYKASDGKKYELVGALDIYTEAGSERFIGNFCFESENMGKIVGFENHAGRTYLGEGVKPLGKVLAGKGNNGSDATEGARYKNVFATYAHGAVLPKNPAFADMLIKTALERKYGRETELLPLDDTTEMNANKYMVARLGCE